MSDTKNVGTKLQVQQHKIDTLEKRISDLEMKLGEWEYAKSNTNLGALKDLVQDLAWQVNTPWYKKLYNYVRRYIRIGGSDAKGTTSKLLLY